MSHFPGRNIRTTKLTGRGIDLKLQKFFFSFSAFFKNSLLDSLFRKGFFLAWTFLFHKNVSPYVEEPTLVQYIYRDTGRFKSFTSTKATGRDKIPGVVL